jgi:membrane-bound metallopeptidase
MERMMNDMMTYNENIAMILEGNTPVARTLPGSDSTRASKVLVMPSAEDSLLRAQMEGDGPYSLAGRGSDSRRRIREAIELAKPVEGIITERFDISQGRFGVKIAAAASDRIAAVDGGTVVQSLWTPERGYTVIMQHRGGLLSVYRNLSQSLAAPGQTLRPGELVGYNSEAENGEVRMFEFELWSDGKPVDPESYIVF